jgi:hypothetical protein
MRCVLAEDRLHTRGTCQGRHIRVECMRFCTGAPSAQVAANVPSRRLGLQAELRAGPTRAPHGRAPARSRRPAPAGGAPQEVGADDGRGGDDLAPVALPEGVQVQREHLLRRAGRAEPRHPLLHLRPGSAKYMPVLGPLAPSGGAAQPRGARGIRVPAHATGRAQCLSGRRCCAPPSAGA